MAPHFAIGLGLALILACCFGIVIREIRKFYEDERAVARLALMNEELRRLAEAGVRSAEAQRLKLPAPKPRPLLLLPPPRAA